MASDLIQPLLIFSGSAVFVIFGGIYLARYGDILAELTGWGRLWVGTVLVAMATSIPELVTNISAVSINAPELAVGNIFGANMVNMFTLAMVTLIFANRRLFSQISQGHGTLAVSAILLTFLALVLGYFPSNITIFNAGISSLIILTAYLCAMRLVYIRRPTDASVNDISNTMQLISLRKAWVFFGLATLVVGISAFFLAYSVDRISDISGLSGSFLGVVSVALVTTMPEATVTVAAVRAGSIDLGVGNLYGSCTFNILVLALADPFYTVGPLLNNLDTAHLAAGVTALTLMSLVLSQILLRGQSKWAPILPTMTLIGIIYLVGIYAVFRLS